MLVWRGRPRPRTYISAEATTSRVIRSLLRHDVGMPCNLLPASSLFHPYTSKTEMLGLPGVRHLSAPHHGLAACHDRRVAIEPEILYLPIIGSDHQKTGFHHPQNLLLIHKFV